MYIKFILTALLSLLYVLVLLQLPEVKRCLERWLRSLQRQEPPKKTIEHAPFYIARQRWVLEKNAVDWAFSGLGIMSLASMALRLRELLSFEGDLQQFLSAVAAQIGWETPLLLLTSIGIFVIVFLDVKAFKDWLGEGQVRSLL